MDNNIARTYGSMQCFGTSDGCLPVVCMGIQDKSLRGSWQGAADMVRHQTGQENAGGDRETLANMRCRGVGFFDFFNF